MLLEIFICIVMIQKSSKTKLMSFLWKL
jgi:hypothetical protein